MSGESSLLSSKRVSQTSQEGKKYRVSIKRREVLFLHKVFKASQVISIILLRSLSLDFGDHFNRTLRSERRKEWETDQVSDGLNFFLERPQRMLLWE